MTKTALIAGASRGFGLARSGAGDGRAHPAAADRGTSGERPGEPPVSARGERADGRGGRRARRAEEVS
ncbi:hypothetical protein [Streptosporangium roseum]|uniref:hypothetical protein n=1 Tax=Streptosporangium roseum TaxID=2001 RepID=UPI0011D27793|nr:hypothetical protein [Streptosporangium roseum]